MDEDQQDQYELQLREVFQSFDATGRGSLCPAELADLCRTLHLEEATPTLVRTLRRDQDAADGRVDFEQFKDALILVLSSAGEPAADQDTSPAPESPEARPKFVKDGKRYGRRSVPELRDSDGGFSEVADSEPATRDRREEAEDPAVPRKRERWNAHADGTEEYEAEGQLHFWNPDEPGTPRSAAMPPSERLEERLRGACEDLALSWHGLASRCELLSLCERLGLEVTEDAFENLGSDGLMCVQDFVSWALEHCKPPTPSASTPYRQLKRHHSIQPFDEMGRRIATPSAMTGTIGLCLFSSLDDGTGFALVEKLVDAWLDEGIENSSEILQALDFSLDGKVNLSDLTIALENELLITKNGIHQAALASFKAEIRHLLECVDRELREKEKIRSDFEKTEKLKNQMATEVDEHHSAIERTNDLNLRKLEQEHREKLAAVRTELTKEMDLIQQHANQQREELESQMERMRDDEAFLRDHLSLTIKENSRLESELLEGTEKLVEAENTINKLQKSLDNILKEKFGDLDPGSAEFFLQEERLKRLHSHYENQCREMQDRIDELQAELEEYQTLGRTPNVSLKPSLSEELESRSPGIESDQGLGSEDCQPFNMTLEAEMMMEQLKAQHLQQVENLRAQMESKVSEYQLKVEEQRAAHEEERGVLSLRCQGEVQALQEEMSRVQGRVQELQDQLDQARLERVRLEQSQVEERAELASRHQVEMNSLRQELLEAQGLITKLEDQLKTLADHQATCEQSLTEEWEVLRGLHDEQLAQLEEHHQAVLHARLAEERERMLEDREEAVRQLVEQWEREKDQLQECHEALLQARLEEERQRHLGESEDQRKKIIEQWEKERLELKEQLDGAFQVKLEEERLRQLKDQEQLERSLLENWEKERAQLEESQERLIQARVAVERVNIQDDLEKTFMDVWQNERAQIDEHHSEVLQARVEEERDRLSGERKVLEKRLLEQAEEERARLEESHREAMQELSARHSEERERLSSALDRLREEIALERRELEVQFSQRIGEVEARFSGDQKAVSERFQTDVAKLEQHYQSEIRGLSERHSEERTKWKAEMDEAAQVAEQEKRALQEVLEQEKQSLSQELLKEREQLEQSHTEEFNAMTAKNKELQNELENLISTAQSREIELSRQLNELHNRLQENLDTKDELLAQSEKKVEEFELLLRQVAEDFEQEKAQLQGNLNQLEEENKQTLCQVEEREKLLAETEHLKSKIQEMEAEMIRLLELEENVGEIKRGREESLGVITSLQNEIEGLKAEIQVLAHSEKEQELHSENALETEAFSGDNHVRSIQFPLPDGKVCGENAGEDGEEGHSQDRVSQLEKETKIISKLQADYEEAVKERDLGICWIAALQGQVDRLQSPACLLAELQDQCVSMNEKNLALQEQVYRLQLNGSELENILEDNNENMAAGAQALEEISYLKDEIYAMTEYTKEMEAKTSEMEDLQARYEDCICENARLREQNRKLEDQFLDLDRKVSLIHNFKDQHDRLQDEMTRVKEENSSLLAQVRDMHKRNDIFMVLQQDTEIALAEAMSEDTLQDLSSQLEAKIRAVSDLQDCCAEFERQNSKLRRALTGLQDKSLEIQQSMRVHRNEAGRLAEENVILRQGISALKEEDLLNTQEEMLCKLEHYKKERLTAQRVAENLKKQVAELRVREQQLEQENQLLSQKNAKNAADVQELNHRLSEVPRLRDRKEAGRCLNQPAEPERDNLTTESAQERKKMEAFVFTLESKLSKAQEGNSLLEQEKVQLTEELSSLREKLCGGRDLTADLASAMSRVDKLQKENETLSTELSHCVDKMAKLGTVECQLSRLLEERLVLEKQTQALRAQLTAAQEKVQAKEEALQTVNLQNARLKSDLRVTQQEKEALKQEVMSLHKRLQNANDKNQVLEMTLHTSGYQTQHKKLYWDELARLVEQEQQLLRQENERLQREVQNTKGDLGHARDKTRQLETMVLSLKQQKQQGQSSLVKAVEQEKAGLKRELDSLRKELVSANRKVSELSDLQKELASLRQENEGLKNQQACLEARLLEALQAQLGGLVPQAQLRERRGQHRGDELGGRGLELNLQDEQEVRLIKMEEHLREVELKLRNVKMLLQEKVCQLKDQLHKNTKADVMVKDLYLENAQLLKALELTEQRQKVAEKKNYLLEEKISSLNKIVRDLSPSPLAAAPYRFSRS